ncbi:uncharacterized protein [Temnothorax nylanderi]|uniref:uncharacterized protein n=1 Tax=Temnothorax nylanderi TaxID=102681 RepID=UPI003A8C40A7
METIHVQNKILSDLYMSGDKKDVEVLVEYIRIRNPLDEDKEKVLREKLSRSFFPVFAQKWKNSFYNAAKFNASNEKWLMSDFIVNFQDAKVGRKSVVDYEIASKSTKRRKILSIIDSYSPTEIQDAFLTNLRTSGKQKIAEAIVNLLAEVEEPEIAAVVPFTQEEAIAVAEDAKLSKHQYETLRIRLNGQNANVFPLYSRLEDAKRACLPKEGSIAITEWSARIELQDLLDVTVTRLLQVPNILSADMLATENVTLKCFYKYGCDGASDQSRYNQIFTTKGKSDAGVFMASIVPLRLQTFCELPLMIWKNPNPGSTSLCRPIMYEQVPETNVRTRIEIQSLQEKISKLVPTEVKLPNSDFKITVTHDLSLTMIDGKVCQAISETSSAATCYICSAKPSEMNDLAKVTQKPEKTEYFEFGLSTLHAWIRLMECILHIGYRLDFCKWAACTPDHKAQLKSRKKLIQEGFYEKMGLIVDIPKHGSGTTNTGNTARRFFRDPELASEITGVSNDLIRRFGIILQTMASGEEINTVKFGEYCFETAELYVDKYKWYYMPVTVHKILLHGASIIEAAFLPIGELSEEAQEARNKDFKRFREFHTRKCSRVVTNTDITRKLLITSDPLINYHRKKWKTKVMLLNPEAQLLLAHPR